MQHRDEHEPDRDHGLTGAPAERPVDSYPDDRFPGERSVGPDDDRTRVIDTEVDTARPAIIEDPRTRSGWGTSMRDEILLDARYRFGGIDLPAAIAGLFAALGLAVVLAGIAGAIGTIGYQRGVEQDDLSLGGLIVGLAVLFVSFLFGGRVVGRIARYDGATNGVLAAVLFLLVIGGLTALGNWADDRYDFLDEVRLPAWFSSSSTTAIASAVAGVVVMVLAAALGGALGTRYHRRADRQIADTTTGMLTGHRSDTRIESSRPHRRVVR